MGKVQKSRKKLKSKLKKKSSSKSSKSKSLSSNQKKTSDVPETKTNHQNIKQASPDDLEPAEVISCRILRKAMKVNHIEFEGKAI